MKRIGSSKFVILLAAIAAVLIVSPAGASTRTPATGTIVSFQGDQLALKTDLGVLTFSVDKDTQKPADLMLAEGKRVTVWYDSGDNPLNHKVDAREIEPAGAAPSGAPSASSFGASSSTQSPSTQSTSSYGASSPYGASSSNPSAAPSSSQMTTKRTSVTGRVTSIEGDNLVIETDTGSLKFDIDKDTEKAANLDLAVGKRITVWYDSDDNPLDHSVDARRIDMAPGGQMTTASAKTRAQTQEKRELPRTASPLPLLGLAGLLALGGGLVFRRATHRA